MGDRIKQIRKQFSLTQVEFGKKIGLKGNTITCYEKGLRIPSDSVILSICREFNVNRQWLETGEGEMFSNASDGEMENILRATQDSPAMRSLMLTWFQLNDANKRALEAIVENYVAEYKRQKADSSNVDHKE